MNISWGLTFDIAGNSLIGKDKSGLAVLTVRIENGILTYQVRGAKKEIPLETIDVIVLKHKPFPIGNSVDFLAKWPNGSYGKMGGFEAEGSIKTFEVIGVFPSPVA